MTKKIKAMIADDEIMARKALSSLIQEFCPEVIISYEASTIEEAIAYLENNWVDVIFLDINFRNNRTGFEILDAIRKYKGAVVVVSAHKEFALKAFKYNALHYLLKPVSLSDLLDTMERISQTIALPAEKPEEPSKYILLPYKNQIEMVLLEDIEYVQVKGSYSIFVLKNGTEYLLAKSLKFFEDYVQNNTSFIRVQKSFIINKHYIKAIYKQKKLSIEMRNGTNIMCSILYSELSERL